ncbi:MAG: nitroreductase family protein [Ruthenibacterium lactatiformans]
MPEWLNGMEAALLAPTAMNQQKFSLNCFLTVKSMRFVRALHKRLGIVNIILR